MIDPRSPNYANTPVSPDRARYGYAPVGANGLEPSDDYSRVPHRPAVSVITPFFNTGPIFHQTAACVLGQSLQDFEWIIINDCSTDPGALGVLAEYRPGGVRNPRGDARIRVVDHAANHGLPAARNTGFRAARSKYVFQLDSDDLIEPTTLEKCALFLEANPAFAFVKGSSVGFEGQQYLWEKGFHDREGFLRQNLVTATAMIRREVHELVGGFDETIRGGMEDWEFWLRAASMGHWGATIPEFLDWYRRRPPQVFDAWANLKCEEANKRFKDRMHREHAALFAGGFPDPQRPWHMPYEPLWEGPALSNGLLKPEGRKRFLMIVPWFRMGGADRFNLDLVKFLVSEGWEVTIVATLTTGTGPQSPGGNGHPWLADFAAFTPDIFILPHLGTPPQFPALTRHLVESRRPDVVMVTNSELGYAILPWLRTVCPGPAYVDFNHMEEPQWKNGGHPRHGAGAQAVLDLNITVSGHLKRWMCAPPRDAYGDRIEVCHINADTQRWKPDAAARRQVRSELGIDGQSVVILYAARLCTQKQPHIFAESIRKLRDLPGERPRVCVLVAGDGELEPQLRDSLCASGLLGEGAARQAVEVRMLGPVATGSMPGLMAASDIFFLPSLWEGIAMSIYEAMAAGLAVVGADVGGQAELVTPETGILLPRPDNDPGAESAAYARVLAGLIADSGRRAALGTAARRRIVEHFELANMGARILDLFALAQEHRSIRPRKPLDRHYARELTQQAIESLRAQELADNLWQYRVKWYGQNQESMSAAVSQDQLAAEALAYIEGSSLFRLIQKCKRLPLYGVYARKRFGRDWERQIEASNGLSPQERLAKVRSSSAYRATVVIKGLPPVKVVTRLRHGRNYHETIPSALRKKIASDRS